MPDKKLVKTRMKITKMTILMTMMMKMMTMRMKTSLILTTGMNKNKKQNSRTWITQNWTKWNLREIQNNLRRNSFIGMN